MKLTSWLNGNIPDLTQELEKSMKKEYPLSFEHCIGKQGRDEIFSILDDFLALLFPGSFRTKKITIDDISFTIDNTMRHAGIRLYRYLSDMYCGDNVEKPEKLAQKNVEKLLTSLPFIRSELIEDIQFAQKSDPAAKSLDEIVLGYPFVEALSTYRISHNLYKQNVPIVPRIMTERAHSHTGIDIHPGAEIAPGFFIDHGTGVVIGETCTIGRNVILYQGVTLGAKSPFDREGEPLRGKKRHPDIGDDVIIYANATILGGNTVIGKNSVIGGNTWITSSIPPDSFVYRGQNYTLKKRSSP